MSVVLDALLVDANSNAVFPATLVVEIYQKTEKHSSLRKWLVVQVAISIDVDDFEEFAEYWPAEALVDLAMFCHARYVPPLKLGNMSEFHQTSFKTYSDSK